MTKKILLIGLVMLLIGAILIDTTDLFIFPSVLIGIGVVTLICAPLIAEAIDNN